MDWTQEAKDAVSKVPFFVRGRVRRKVEEEAAGQGAKAVTLEHVRSSQRKFLDRMEDEVKGFQVETCFGPGGCPNRAVSVDGLSEDLTDLLARRDLRAFLKARVQGPLKMHHEFRVSVSDCPNACSRPQIVDLGIIGASLPEITDEDCTACGECVKACREKAIALSDDRPALDLERCLYCGQCARACPTGTLREGRRGFRIQVGGKLGRHPRLATELPGLFAPDEVLAAVERGLDFYQRHCRGGERLGEILERTGLQELTDGCEPGQASTEGPS